MPFFPFKNCALALECCLVRSKLTFTHCRFASIRIGDSHSSFDSEMQLPLGVRPMLCSGNHTAVMIIAIEDLTSAESER